MQMTVHDQQIEIAVVVVIDETDSPPDVRFGESRKLRSDRRFAERELAGIQVQRVVLRIEVRDYDVRTSVAVRVTGVNSHAGAGDAIGVESHFGDECGIAKRAVLLIEQKKVGGRVASDEQIHPAVAVQIDGHYAK